MPSPNGPLRVGIGGPVGSGKTALMDALCKAMRETYDLAAITNDIYTKWDAEFLVRSGSLPPERITPIAATASSQFLQDRRLASDRVHNCECINIPPCEVRGTDNLARDP